MQTNKLKEKKNYIISSIVTLNRSISLASIKKIDNDDTIMDSIDFDKYLSPYINEAVSKTLDTQTESAHFSNYKILISHYLKGDISETLGETLWAPLSESDQMLFATSVYEQTPLTQALLHKNAYALKKLNSIYESLLFQKDPIDPQSKKLDLELCKMHRDVLYKIHLYIFDALKECNGSTYLNLFKFLLAMLHQYSCEDPSNPSEFSKLLDLSCKNKDTTVSDVYHDIAVNYLIKVYERNDKETLFLMLCKSMIDKKISAQEFNQFSTKLLDFFKPKSLSAPDDSNTSPTPNANTNTESNYEKLVLTMKKFVDILQQKLDQQEQNLKSQERVKIAFVINETETSEIKIGGSEHVVVLVEEADDPDNKQPIINGKIIETAEFEATTRPADEQKIALPPAAVTTTLEAPATHVKTPATVVHTKQAPATHAKNPATVVHTKGAPATHAKTPATVVHTKQAPATIPPDKDIKKPDPVVDTTIHDLKIRHAHNLQIFDNKLALLQVKITDLTTRNMTDALDAAIKLQTALIGAKKIYFVNGTTPTKASYLAFKKTCDDAIAVAHQTLDSHRGWSEFLANLAIGISTFGIGLLIKGAINMANKQRFFAVHETASSKVLHDIDNSIATMAV